MTIADERVRPKRRTPMTVIPYTLSNSIEEPSTSNTRGSMLTCTPSDFTRWIVASITSESVPSGATITRSISYASMIRSMSSSAPSTVPS